MAQTDQVHREINNIYNLNIDKALMKKLEATQRAVHIEYKYTSGGIVIVADAATLELIKHASIAYYEAFPESDGETFIQKQTDKSKNANVQIDD